MMKKAGCFFGSILFALILFPGCNNFFHEVIPPDENRIVSFAVPDQKEGAVIGDNRIDVLVGPGADTGSLLPEITVSPKASLIPLTLNYVALAFPSINILEAAMGIYTAEDLSEFVINLIRENPDFTVPPLAEAMDFTGPVNFLVVSGRGTIRQYTVRVTADTGTAKLLGFGFSKYDNPELMRDALTFVDEAAKTAYAAAVFPVEIPPVSALIPGFEILGDSLEIDGATLRSGIDPLAFDTALNNPSPALPQTKTIRVHRSGYPSAEYTLVLAALEDPDTIRSITDFRFTKADNPGIAAAASASIFNSDNLGTIRVQVLYRGAKPAVLKARYVSPGTVTAGGTLQISGATENDFSSPLEYKVVSRNGLYTRIYTVQVEFINVIDLAPKILSFRFPADINGELAQTAQAEINDAAGLILIDAKYTGTSAPRDLIPEFSSSGIVKVSGLPQTSGSSAQDFSRQVKYTAVSPDDPGVYREYWVQTRFIRDTSADAAVTAFSFHPAENPQLADEVPARIDQLTGHIYAYLPFGANIAAPLIPRFSAYGNVSVSGALQISGSSAQTFDHPVIYSAVSANGENSREYTVTVQELNTRLYVNQNAAGLNNGASWADAFISLKTACETAALFPDGVPREIWIAAGTYTPSLIGDVTEYFPLTPDTSYIGGFAGHEAGKSSRNPAANPVTISGDLGGGLRSRHLFQTLSGGGNLVFEDLAFTKAKTLPGTAPDNSGAAINVTLSNGSVEIKNCAFTELEAGYQGGAVYISGGSVTMEGIDITNTSGTNTHSGIYISSPTGTVDISHAELKNAGLYSSAGMTRLAHINVVNSPAFVNDQIEIRGGADIANVTVDGTSASGIGGGGIYVYIISASGSQGRVEIRDTEIRNTKTSTGGGGGLNIHNLSGQPTVISGLVIENAKAVAGGGAMIWVTGALSITDTKIKGTEAVNHGGGLFITNASGLSVSEQPTVISGLTVENTKSGSHGGGALINVYGALSITNTTIKGTEAGDDGGGLNINNTSGPPTFISGLTIENAKTTGSSTNGGGVKIWVSEGALSIANTVIKDTEATGSGGGLHIQASNTLASSGQISGLTVVNAKAGIYGGAIAGYGLFSCLLEDASFWSCTALSGIGSIVYGNGPAYTIGSNCSVEGTVITSSNLNSVLPYPSRRHPYGSINVLP